MSGAYFANGIYGGGQPESDAVTIQMFGYDGSDQLLGSSGVLSLTSSFQWLAGNLAGIEKLEIRADADNKWFLVDDISLAPTAVPGPASIVLMVPALMLLGVCYRRERHGRFSAL